MQVNSSQLPKKMYADAVGKMDFAANIKFDDEGSCTTRSTMMSTSNAE